MSVLKEKYFNGQLILKKAEHLKSAAEQISPRNDIQYIPRKSALLVIDMQNCFLEDNSSSFIPSADAIIPGIRLLADRFSTASRPVIFTRHLNTQGNARLMSRWWSDLINEDDPSSNITDRLDSSSATVIKKSQYDSFLETDLENILRRKRISQIVICGVMTHLCCESTARSAFMRGFEVFFAIDGTATYNEEFHRAAIINLSHGFAKAVLVSDIIAAMDRSDEVK